MKLRSVAVNGLRTDMSYQSPVKENQVKKIVKNFDPQSVDSIVVSRRSNGFYYIVDGQHRVEALRRLNITQVLAKIHSDLTVEEEAKLYRDINTRPTKSPKSMAKASIKHGDEHAIRIMNTVNATGMQIDFDNQNATVGYIGAYRSLERIVKDYGDLGLIETISFIKRVYGNESKYFQGFVMEGFAKFLANYYTQINQDSLKERLEKLGYNSLMAEVNKQRPNFKSKKECLPFVLADIYNKKRKQENKVNKQFLMI